MTLLREMEVEQLENEHRMPRMDYCSSCQEVAKLVYGETGGMSGGFVVCEECNEPSIIKKLRAEVSMNKTKEGRGIRPVSPRPEVPPLGVGSIRNLESVDLSSLGIDHEEIKKSIDGLRRVVQDLVLTMKTANENMVELSKILMASEIGQLGLMDKRQKRRAKREEEEKDEKSS